MSCRPGWSLPGSLWSPEGLQPTTYLPRPLRCRVHLGLAPPHHGLAPPHHCIAPPRHSIAPPHHCIAPPPEVHITPKMLIPGARCQGGWGVGDAALPEQLFPPALFFPSEPKDGAWNTRSVSHLLSLAGPAVCNQSHMCSGLITRVPMADFLGTWV